jgi:Erythromycin esterase
MLGGPLMQGAWRIRVTPAPCTERRDVPPARRIRAGLPTFRLGALLDSRGPQVRAAVARPRPERAVGGVYRPGTERRSRHFGAVPPERFDAFVWFAETTAVTSLPDAGRARGSDTSPSAREEKAP